ncbi:hypothetical protein FN846DRAFT_902245 [Sphaerosporella brunnea]|uniref:Uncharacterized protein n=1 Tax=Sphaerosporella brunnea TaxID=1250544 RepID=A0A5J5F9N0_9PEZI|nr:hypothetical protein FN846DRAFT_902245 [Sphaerosporella brunnea]
MNNDDGIPAYQRSTVASRRRIAIGPALSRPPRRPVTAGVRAAQRQDSSHAPPLTGHRTVPTQAAGAVAAAADSALSFHRAQRSTSALIPPVSRPPRRPAIQQSRPRAPPLNNRFTAGGNYTAPRVLAFSNSALAPHKAQRPRKADSAADTDTHRRLFTPLAVAPVAAPTPAVPQPVAQIAQLSSRPAPAYVCSDPFAPPFTRPKTPYRLQHGIIRARDLPADWPFVVPGPVSRDGRPSRERVKDRL